MPVHYILTSFVTLIGWVSVIVGKVTRDAESTEDSAEVFEDEESQFFLPPTTIYGSIQGRSDAPAISSFNDSVEITVNASNDRMLPPPRANDEDAPISIPRMDSDAGAPTVDGPVFIMPSIPRLAALMLDSKQGIPLQDHSRFLKSYPRSFTGKEAVDWLQSRLPTAGLDRTQAVAVLQTMTEKGYIASLSRSRQQFDDGDEVFGLADVRRANLPVAKLESSSSTQSGGPTSPSNQAPSYLSPRDLPREILILVADLRDPATGITIRDRRLTNSVTGTMTTYPRCFQGVEALDWLLMRKRLTQIEDTKALLNVLIQADLICDIGSTDSAVVPRFNEKHYYRFRVDDSSNASSHPKIVEKTLVNQVLTKLKSPGANGNTGMQSLDEYYKLIAASPARPTKEKARDDSDASVASSLPKPIIRDSPSPSPSMSSASRLPDVRSPSVVLHV